MATYAYALPELGEGIESGDVVQVLVAVGNAITKDQPLLELETDKAVIEVPAPVSGVVQAVHVHEGDTAAVGQLIVTLETSDIDTSPVVPEPDTAAAEPETSVAVESGPPALPQPPQIDVAESSPVADLGGPSAHERQAAPAAPSVRRLAREIGVDISQVPGSGPGGRISIEDVKEHARRLHTETAGVQMHPGPMGLELPDFTRWGAVERQPMSNIRRKTAEHMTRAWLTIPHVTQFGQADITELEELRQRYAPRAEALGGKLTITAIVLKVLVAALKHFPQFNASLDLTRQEIVYKKYYHIGVAVDTDRGLLVPVIRHVDQKSIFELSVELTQMAERARSRKTAPEEMQGGTFTLTNLGGIGGTNFSPIINAPEVAILGLARSSMQPVYRAGQFEPRLLLPLALSYDHRLIDGADGARCIRWITEALQQPFLIALEG
jgi:pyruvate dehydrogenase E2 component (dihydrolipoamide acetyltransferase)